MKYPFNPIRIFSLLLFLLLNESSNAQLIKPLGKGLPYPAQNIYIDSSQKTRLAVQLVSSSKDSLLSRYLISEFIGSEWLTITSVVTRVSDSSRNFNNIHSISSYNNRIYIAGSFDSIGYPAIANTARIAQWDYTNWTSLNTGIGRKPKSIVRKMEVFGGKLYVAGEGFVLGSDSFLNLLAWSGSFWNKLGQRGPDSAVYDLKRYKGKLLTAGKFITADSGILAHAIATWSGSTWSAVAGYPGQYINDIEIFGDSIYTYSKNPDAEYLLYFFNGNSWKNISSNIGQFPLKSADPATISTAGNRLWISLESADPEQTLLYLKDSLWIPFPTEALGRVSINSFHDTLIIYGSFKRNEGTYLDGVGIVESNFPDLIRIRGRVFNDVSGNCVYDPGDEPLVNHKLRIQPGNYLAITDEQGIYHRYLPRNAYKIFNTLPQGFNYLCTTDSLSADSLGTYRSFPLKSRPSFRNHSVQISSSTAFKAPKAQIQYLSIKVNNHSMKNDSVLLVLEYDSLLSWVSSSPAPLSKIGSKVTYLLENIPGNSYRQIEVGLRTDSAVAAMSSIFHKAYLSTASMVEDSVNSDDLDTMHQYVSAPLDPNDKQSWPQSRIKPGTEKIKYQIRFQNVGNEKAIRVRVIDTVDTDLPLTAVWIENASHPFSIYIENNVLTWVFDNINLPDSGSDFEQSQGYLCYSASLKPGMAIGTEIRNTAMIYFDYEAPVRTNTVLSKIEDDDISVNEPIKLSMQLLLYPNPSIGVFSIENKAANDSKLRIYDLMGRNLWEAEIQAHAKLNADLSFLPDGVYFIKTDKGESARILIQR